MPWCLVIEWLSLTFLFHLIVRDGETTIVIWSIICITFYQKRKKKNGLSFWYGNFTPDRHPFILPCSAMSISFVKSSSNKETGATLFRRGIIDSLWYCLFVCLVFFVIFMNLFHISKCVLTWLSGRLMTGATPLTMHMLSPSWPLFSTPTPWVDDGQKITLVWWSTQFTLVWWTLACTGMFIGPCHGPWIS